MTYDGNVTWLVPKVTKSSCQISVEHFPLDEQVCLCDFLLVTTYLLQLVSLHEGKTLFLLFVASWHSLNLSYLSDLGLNKVKFSRSPLECYFT